ncbi:MAG: glycosyltransferase, partial [Verrucomicrobiia bacterium]
SLAKARPNRESPSMHSPSPTPKYRVLHVIDSLDLGGAQEALENLIRFGNREIFEFEVASMHRHGVYSERLRALGVPVHALSLHKFLPLYVPSLVALLAGKRFDIVHFHLTWANLIAKPLARLLGVRLLFNHDQTNEQFRHAGGVRFHWDTLTNRLSSHVFAVSKSIHAFLATREKIEPERLSVVYNGIDPCRFPYRTSPDASAKKTFGLPHDAFVIGGVGRLHPQKNFPLFVDVARQALQWKHHLRFVIAGDGPLKAGLQKLIDDNGLADKVKLIGFVPDTSKLFPALDLLMMTSNYEGLPLTLLEAMSSGVLTLCSAVDGIQEIIVDKENGFLAAPRSPEAFLTGLRFILENPMALPPVREAARRTIQDRFTANVMTRSVESIYLEALANRRF